MELLVQDVENKQKFCTNRDDTTRAICNWDGVQINAEERVVNINWSIFYRLSGSLHLEWIPSKVTYFAALANLFTGSADLTNLPEVLHTLSLTQNQFSGSIDLTQLPSNINRLSLNSNCFSGDADFSRLPDSLTHLDVSNNSLLSGHVKDFFGKSIFLVGTRVHYR
eukprot:CAMPEP_0201523536 /NCGR_PEP_ID=MMETSP0161_2-20130828/20234_1 /ASSEMBLY_ACC=CAM_ASM_000251 /TAXON_ID=180227 /ORGANISM="Neoparamoeba aestuarina, Strain SoJaBio B1-5/56/2" /LENGTH=165 /DNA_ID=CAMNT_0047922689 /DNA_START=101 /DNA_END=595 /DNA_ORIENTATION=-